MQGYLPITSNLWSIAGAKRSDFFESHKSRLLACFEVRKVGGKEVLYFPPLIESMRKQMKRLRNRRSVDKEFSTDSQPSTERAGGFTSPSQSDLAFDFDSNKSNHNQKTSNARTNHGYTQADFDARDLRKLAEAAANMNEVIQKQPWLTEGDLLELQCERAGIPIERAVELKKMQSVAARKLAATGD